ncbi:hypothetical protein ACWYRQ_06850 [Clostridioides difficile]
MDKRKKEIIEFLKPLLSEREIKHLMDALDANMIICVGVYNYQQGSQH